MISNTEELSDMQNILARQTSSLSIIACTANTSHELTYWTLILVP